MAKQIPEFPFGAVIVRQATGVIVAEGHNRSSESPTFHGEIVVINRCAADHHSIDWTELDLYTTAELCPMCQSAIEWAGIPTVYYGSLSRPPPSVHTPSKHKNTSIWLTRSNGPTSPDPRPSSRVIDR